MRERSKEMISFIIEIIITGVMFFVGVYAVVVMHRAAQRTVSEWRTSARHVTTPQERRLNLLTLVLSLLTGIFVLPHLPEHYTALLFQLSGKILYHTCSTAFSAILVHLRAS